MARLAAASSYPACLAVKAAAEQGGGGRYLRRARGLCLRAAPAGHADALIAAAREVAGLDVERFGIDLRSNAIVEAFGADLERAGASPSQRAGGHGACGAVDRVPRRAARHGVYGAAPTTLAAAARAAGREPTGARRRASEAALRRFGPGHRGGGRGLRPARAASRGSRAVAPGRRVARARRAARQRRALGAGLGRGRRPSGRPPGSAPDSDPARPARDGADPRARVMAREQRRPRRRPESGRTTQQNPQPMLKTCCISAGRRSRHSSRDQAEHRRDGQRRVDLEADLGLQAQEVQQPVAGDVREAVDRHVGAQQLEHRAHVDHGRLEQGVGDGGAAERLGPVVERQAAVLEQRAPREREPVGVQAGGGEADERVAGRQAAPVTIASSATVPKHAAVEVEALRRGMAADQLGQLGELAAGDLDPGLLGARLQPERDLAQHLGSARSTAR